MKTFVCKFNSIVLFMAIFWQSFSLPLIAQQQFTKELLPNKPQIDFTNLLEYRSNVPDKEYAILYYDNFDINNSKVYFDKKTFTKWQAESCLSSVERELSVFIQNALGEIDKKYGKNEYNFSVWEGEVEKLIHSELANIIDKHGIKDAINIEYLEKEIDKIVYRETRSRKLSYSKQRSKSEEFLPKADINLIENTEDLIEKLHIAQDALVELLEEGKDMGNGDVYIPDVAGASWLAQWNRSFEQSLNSWEIAEGGFLTRRLDWEEEVWHMFNTIDVQVEQGKYALAELANIYIDKVNEYQIMAAEKYTADIKNIANIYASRSSELFKNYEQALDATHCELNSYYGAYANLLDQKKHIEIALYNVFLDVDGKIPQIINIAEIDKLRLSNTKTDKISLDLFESLKKGLKEVDSELTCIQGAIQKLLEPIAFNKNILQDIGSCIELYRQETERDFKEAQALFNYATKVQAGKIERGNALPSEGESGFELIQYYVFNPSLDISFVQKLYDVAIENKNKVESIQKKLQKIDINYTTNSFNDLLLQTKGQLEDYKTIAAIQEKSEIYEMNLIKDRDELKIAWDAICKHYDVKGLKQKEVFSGEDALLFQSLERLFSSDIDTSILAMAQVHIVNNLKNYDFSEFIIGESDFLSRVIGNQKIDDESISSIMDSYRGSARNVIAENLYGVLTKEQKEDLLLFTLMQNNSNQLIRDMQERLRYCVEEFEYSTLMASLNEEIEDLDKRIGNTTAGGVIAMSVGLCLAWNPFGWIILGGGVGAEVATGVMYSTLSELEGIRSQVEENWENRKSIKSEARSLLSQDLVRACLASEQYIAAEESLSEFKESKAETALKIMGNTEMPTEFLGKNIPLTEAINIARNGLVESIENNFSAFMGMFDKEMLLRKNIQDNIMYELSACLLNSEDSMLINNSRELSFNLQLNSNLFAEWERLSGEWAFLLWNDPPKVNNFSVLNWAVLPNNEFYLSSSQKNNLLNISSSVLLELSKKTKQQLFENILLQTNEAINQSVLALETVKGNWEECFVDAYNVAYSEWEAAWEASQDLKGQWLENCVEAFNQTCSTQTMAILENEANIFSRRLDSVVIPRKIISFEPVGNNIKQILSGAEQQLYNGSNKLSSLLGLQSLPVSTDNLVLFADYPIRERQGNSSIVQSINKEIAKRELNIANLFIKSTALKSLQELEQGFLNALLLSNEAYDREVDSIYMGDYNWAKIDRMYNKRITVHSTVIDSVITERFYETAYHYLIAEDVGFRYIPESVIEDDNVSKIMEDLSEDYNLLYESVFGSETRIGCLYEHIGESPEYGEDGEMTNPGTGELGRLMKTLMEVIQKEAIGWQKVNIALYDKPIWDDRYGAMSWLKSPSIRDVADVATGIVATVATAGMGFTAVLALNTLITLSDDIVFGLADMNLGIDPGEVLLSLGQKTLTSLACPAIGQGFSQASNSLFGNLSGVLGWTARTGMDVASVTTTAAFSSAVQAFEWNGSSIDWSADNFYSGFTTGLPASYAFSLSQNLLNIGVEGFTGQLKKDAEALTSLGAGLIAEGVRYGTEGNLSLNFLNIGDFTQGKYSTGLLSLDVVDENVSVSLSRDGTQVNANTLMKAGRGLESLKVNIDILGAEKGALIQHASALRTLYTSGNVTGNEYENILKGKTIIAKNGSGDYVAKSIYDEETDTKYVLIGNEGLNDTSRFGKNILLSHEAYRDGLVETELEQNLETARAVAGHSKVAMNIHAAYGSGSLTASLAGEAQAFERALKGDADTFNRILASYDTSEDFWRLNDDGSIGWDGNRALYDKDGRFLRLAVDEEGLPLGFGESLVEFVGLEEAKEFLGERGISTENKTNKEIGSLLLGFYGDGKNEDVPDYSMNELMCNSDLSYSQKRNEWLQAGSRFEGLEIDETGSIENKIIAGADVRFQKNSRDMILFLEDYFTEDASSKGPAVLEQQEILNELKGRYDAQYVTSGMAFTPENFISQTFMNELVDYNIGKSNYLSYVHSGLDLVGDSQVISPGFMISSDVPSGYSHGLVLELPGSDIHFRLLHLESMAGNTSYNPGDVIGKFGNVGDSSGPHLHLECTDLNTKGQRGFVDPLKMGGDWHSPQEFPYLKIHKNKDGTEEVLEKYRSVIPR